MATTGGANSFVLNITELTNVVTTASGLTPFSVLSNQIGQIQEMVIYDEKRIAVNTISKYNTEPIQVVDPINIGPTGGLTIGGDIVYAGGGGSGPTGPTGPASNQRTSVINQAATTVVTFNSINAYMSNGALWLGSNTGNAINIYGQAQWSYNGGSANATIPLMSVNTATLVTATPGSGVQGDLVVAVIADATNQYLYRITGQQSSVLQTGSYSIVIEQLG